MIILNPIITEKSIQDASAGKFTFAVDKSMNKRAIRQIIEDKFKVHVVSVATSVVKGRQTRVGKRRTEITQSAWKKASAKLAKGEKIELFDVGGQK